MRLPFCPRRGCRIAIIAAVSLALCSCGTNQIVNHINLAQTAGYDMENKKVQSSILIGEYIEKEKTSVRLLEAESSNSFDMMPLLNLESGKPIKYGQMKMMVFGKAYARHGIGPVLNILSRDVKVSSRMQLGIADTKASELMAATIPSHDTLLLRNMIEQNSDNANLPHFNLHSVLYDYYGEGRDIFLPYFVLNERGTIKLDGIALFKGDRFVVKLGCEEALWLKILTENAKNGSFLFPVSESGAAREHFSLIKIISSRASVQITSLKPVPVLKMKIKMKLMIKNLPDDVHILYGKESNIFKSRLEQHLTSKLESFIELCQSKEVDPAGFGDSVRTYKKDWQEREFYEQYPAMKAAVQVELDIIQTGTES